MWAQTDLRRVLGVTGARVVGEELPVAQVATHFDDEGRLTDPDLRVRLIEHLELLAAEARPALAA